MSTSEQKLEKYAELAVKVGVNVQKGQTLIVNAPIHTANFLTNFGPCLWNKPKENKRM